MGHYQLLAGACLYIASKCDGRNIKCNDISFCADNVFNGKQIMGAEDIVLRQLKWKLAYPVVLDFVLAFVSAAGLQENSRLVWTMRYIAEQALQSPIYLSFKPSLIAASVFVLASICLQEQDLWPASLARQTGYGWEDLEACTVSLSRLVEDVRSTMPDLIIIERRYRKATRHQVAELSVPNITSFAAFSADRQRQLRQVSHLIPMH